LPQEAYANLIGMLGHALGCRKFRDFSVTEIFTANKIKTNTSKAVATRRGDNTIVF
jgi:hypothetical protein